LHIRKADCRGFATSDLCQFGLARYLKTFEFVQSEIILKPRNARHGVAIRPKIISSRGQRRKQKKDRNQNHQKMIPTTIRSLLEELMLHAL